MHFGSFRNPLLLAGVALCLVLALVVPAMAQEGGEEPTDATPEPTMVPADATMVPAMPPMASPPAMPSPSPAAGASGAGSMLEAGSPPPPAVAAGIVSDPLNRKGAVFPDGVCRTGYTLGDYIPDGLELTVLGRCPDDQDTPSLTVPGRNLLITDGDAAWDFKVTGQQERARVFVYVRERDDKAVLATLNFTTNEVSIARREGGNSVTVAARPDLRDIANPTAWNRLALRVRGTDAWLLINDVPILYAAGVMDQTGGIGIGALREGSKEDEAELVVVFKDFTLSSVDGSDPSRAPTR